MVNFYLARGARCSLILSPKHDGAIAEHMFSQVLGVYTQPPFSLHITENGKVNEAYESIRIIMSTCDGVEYPDWNVEKLVPDYPYLGK